MKALGKRTPLDQRRERGPVEVDLFEDFLVLSLFRTGPVLSLTDIKSYVEMFPVSEPLDVFVEVMGRMERAFHRKCAELREQEEKRKALKGRNGGRRNFSHRNNRRG